MNADGHLGAPGTLPCLTCGKPLNPNGHRPAETYAGTFTGECYSCQGRGAFFTGVTFASGAQVWSHPPHCPAWRRDRETFTYWPGCEGQGCATGRVMKNSAGPFGGQHSAQCPACWAKHEAHPTTVEEYRAREARNVASREWERRVIAEAKKRLAAVGKKFDAVPDTDLDFLRVRTEVLALAPARPEGETCPPFPEGWAELPKKKEPRRRY